MRVILSPHAHTCYQPAGAGFDPAMDCPACKWVEEQEKLARAAKKKPVSKVSRFDAVTEVLEESVECGA